MSDLDKDFDKVAEQINAKLKEAAAALKEANRLATEAKLPALIVTQWNEDEFLDAFDPRSDEEDGEESDEEEDDYDDPADRVRAKMELIDVGALERELGNAGWSTSSSYC